jgi:glutathione S-transferase
MSFKLYHQPGSRSGRVVWVLEEIGEPYDIEIIQREDKATPEYRAMHPLGRSPVVVTDEGPLFESAALVLQVADLHPDSGLMPPVGTYERGLVYQWVIFAMTELEPAVVDAYSDDEARKDRGRERFAAALPAVEQAVDGKEFLVGDGLTAADLVIGGVLGFAARGGLLEGSPNAEAYAQRLNDRPARKRAAEVGR